VQLSAVRRILRGGIVADRSTIRLDLDHVDVDLERWFAATDDESIVDGYVASCSPTTATTTGRRRCATRPEAASSPPPDGWPTNGPVRPQLRCSDGGSPKTVRRGRAPAPGRRACATPAVSATLATPYQDYVGAMEELGIEPSPGTRSSEPRLTPRPTASLGRAERFPEDGTVIVVP
jgi:hypothetical protein